MTRTIKTTLALSGFLLALGLAVMPITAHAAEQCVDFYDHAAKSANDKDLKAVSAFLDKAGSCCASDIDPTSAQKIINDIKAIVTAATTASSSKGGNKEDAGKAMSNALGCAGQPGIVAVDPNLYSTVLADSAEFAELARDENGSVGKDVQYARGHGTRPSNNQQPTVSIEQK